MALAPGKLQSAEYSRNTWYFRADSEVSQEEILDPKFYVHVASRMKSGDRIEVMAGDLTWFVELLVVFAEKSSVKVFPLTVHKLVKDEKDEKDEFPDYIIRWAGDTAKHRVVRKADRSVMKSGFPTAEEARAWLRDYLKKEAA